MADQKREFKVQTPGSIVPQSQLPPQAQEPKVVVSDDISAVAPVEINISALTDDQLLQVAAEIQRRTKAQKSADNLPDSSTVDPNEIQRPVLTKDGWVCPIPKENHKAMR